MPTNDFIGFASSGSANIMSQADFAAAAEQSNGVQPGPASSSMANKIWRQGANMAAALGEIVKAQGLDALDNGDIATLANNLGSAIAGLYNVQAITPTLGTNVDTASSHNPSNPILCYRVGPIVVFTFDVGFSNQINAWSGDAIATGLPVSTKNIMFGGVIADNLTLDAWFGINTNGVLSITTRSVALPASKAIVGGGVYIAAN